MICDQTEQIPTSENVIAGLINSTTAAAMVEKMDLNAFTNLQSDQQYTFTCVPTELNQVYHLFLLAEDITFTGESFQTNPSSTMGELESEELCVPIKISSTNTVVLICL